VLIVAAAWTQPVNVSAISLRDDAATIAAADAAKYEVLRRQQEQARIAQQTRSAEALATRQEQSRIAQETRTAGDLMATQDARRIQATRQEQARVAQETRTEGDLMATQDARSVQATATWQALVATDHALDEARAAARATEVVRAQAEEATRQAQAAAARRAQLQMAGVVILFVFGAALVPVSLRALWKATSFGPRPAASQVVEVVAPQAVDPEPPAEPQVAIVDDPQATDTILRMWEESGTV